MEIGRPGEAQELLTRALALGGTLLPQREFQRAWVSLLQASVAAGRTDHAQVQLATMNLTLAQTTPRLLLLADLEAARCAMKENDFSGADDALDRAMTHAPENQDAFERVEVAEAEAELALTRGDAETAAALLSPIIARHADDDLAAREVRARLIQARALEALGRTDEAERTLGAALRRAVARALTGYADDIRSRLMTDYGGPARIADMPMASAETDPGARFVRQRPLGSGAFGRVFRAYDLELGIEVAIKRAARGENYDPETREKLMQAARTEVAATARLDHPGIARAFGLLPLEGGDTLVIEEFIEGPTLRRAMEAGLDHARGFSLLSRIAFALAAVHGAGVIHRDLKPDNIILRGGDAPVLIDFGIALLEDGAEPSSAGTPAYMAPEQAKGRSVDARADLYALGVIAHEMLTGERPEPPRSLLPFMGKSRTVRIEAALVGASVDPRVAALVARLLAPWPRSRPDSAGAVGTFFAKASEASRG
jgi:tRNA A-37 threonylcarbamoyl transferase component Bud32